MSKTQPEQIVEHMMKNDAFSQWLGIEVVDVKAGEVELRMKISPEMLNGFGVVHGGVTFSLADSALAFASGGHGRISLALDVSISYPHPVYSGDILTARAKELHLGKKIGNYHVAVTNQKDVLVAIFQGTVYRTRREFEIVN